MKKLIPLFCLGMILGLAPMAHAEDDEETTPTPQYNQMGDATGAAAESQDSEEKPFKLTEQQREWLKDSTYKDRLDKQVHGEYLFMNNERYLNKQLYKTNMDNEEYRKMLPVKAKDADEND